MPRFALVAVVSAIACTVAFAKTGTFSVQAADDPKHPTESEAIVSEIAGSILNIAASASHFDPAEPFQVRNVGSSDRPRFRLTRRGEVFTITPASDIWEPASYRALAASFMADGAGPLVSQDPATEGTLQDHPRSAALHEKAAKQLASELEGASAADARALRCRITAHLAVAKALKP